MRNKLIILLTITCLPALPSCNSKKYTKENPDSFCQKYLDNGEAMELRDWLFDEKSTLGELQTNEKSIEFANEPYMLGAVNISGFYIDEALCRNARRPDNSRTVN